MKLSDREWGEFFIGGCNGIFNIRASYSGIDKNKLIDNESKEAPYITRSDLNNGISSFVYINQDKKYAIDSGNVITIGLDTQTIFYQKHSFYTGQNIQVITNDNLNKYNALFLITLLKAQLKKFCWGGNGATLGRLAKTKFLLPSNKSELPDYKFMEDYTKKIIDDKKQEYIEYAKNKLKNIEYKEIPRLKDKEWKEFFIEDVFNVSSGVRLTKQDMQKGDRPFIGSSDSNNGITNFTSDKNNSLDKNVLGVNYNGSVVENFYHRYECLFSDDVKRFHLCNYTDNEFILLFFKSIILKQKEKYSYGYKFNGKRMLRQYIMLPTNKDDKPDYEYMEQYSKNIIYKKLNEYLEYISK